MSCDVGKATESLENEQSSFAKLFVASPTSELILQPFRRFTYITIHSPTLPLLHLCHNSLSNPSFASPTSQALHLCHLASCPCLTDAQIKKARRAGSDGSMSASGSADPGFDPRGVANFHLKIFNPEARRGGYAHFLIARLYITGQD